VALSDPSRIAGDDAVLVTVGELDQRAYLAVRLGVELSDGPARAIHVCHDGDDAHAFAVEWMTTGMDFSVPLEIVERPDGCAPAIRSAVEALLRDHAGTITVVIGRLCLQRRWHRLLHDHSAEQILDALADLERVRVELVDIPV
jgi:hypothetical protein